MTEKSAAVQMYQGLGETLEDAVRNAHSKIPPRAGRDFVVCRVMDWGYQRGGFMDSKLFYAKVIEDEFSPLKT